MKLPKCIISREFMKGDELVKQVQNTMFVRNAYFTCSNVSLNQSHACFTSSSNGEDNQFYQVQIDLMIGEPRLQPEQHTDLLTLKGQVYYPGIQTTVIGIYCFHIQLSSKQKQFYNKIISNKQEATGIVKFLADIPVDKINIQPVSDKIDYMYVLSAVLILSSVVWYFLNKP
ncbi:Hypothetical_protein [Hexamita inflata]|uniref:Hypothetical_protein n=1 Tax=Hexamita inflata TaxID=28002 RepID=A0AA86PVE6_9EUKA|nr:Hypothetical protein HINF_LOCUS32502 [Hexamita inflata]